MHWDVLPGARNLPGGNPGKAKVDLAAVHLSYCPVNLLAVIVKHFHLPLLQKIME